MSRTLVVRIRWGVLLEPVCFVAGHRWVPIEAGTWADASGRSCKRCGRDQTSGPFKRRRRR